MIERKRFKFPNQDGEQMPVEARVANALEHIAHYLEGIAESLTDIANSFNDPINPNSQLVTQLSHIRELIDRLNPAAE